MSCDHLNMMKPITNAQLEIIKDDLIFRPFAAKPSRDLLFIKLWAFA